MEKEIVAYYTLFGELMRNWKSLAHSQRIEKFDELSVIANRVREWMEFVYQI